jgi:hypothetical protein
MMKTLVPPLSPDVLASPAYAASMQVRIPAEFWAELKERKLIELDAPVPA